MRKGLLHLFQYEGMFLCTWYDLGLECLLIYHSGGGVVYAGNIWTL